MPPGKKNRLQNQKNNKKAINVGAVTCDMQLDFTGGQTTGHGFSTTKSCAEPAGYKQALAALKSKKVITFIHSSQNEWPCENCKAFFEAKNVPVYIRVDPRWDSAVYFTHWVDAGVIPADHSPNEGLVLRCTAGVWEAGRLR